MEELRLRKSDIILPTLAAAFSTLSLLLLVGDGNIASPVYAISLPTCHLCSIHADGIGAMTAPDPSQAYLCHCDECHADISFDALQIEKNFAIGKLTLIADIQPDNEGNPGGLHTILGDINSGKITEKSFVLKGVITDTQNPDGIGMHFTINGQVGKGTINYSEDDGMTGTFTGNIIVTKTE
jgi:hypothetical protein